MSSPGTAAAAPHPTYGELMDTARLHAAAAHRQLQRSAFVDSPNALAALDARGRLLRALAANARATLGPVRVDAVRDQQVTRHTPDVRTPRTLATLQWLDRLQTIPVVDADTFEPTTAVGAVTRSLRAARITVDAATDLALTHYDGPGRLRPDAAPPLAHSSWGALTVDCLRLVALAAAIEPLAQRCRQAGLTRTRSTTTCRSTMTSSTRRGRSPPRGSSRTVAHATSPSPAPRCGPEIPQRSGPTG